MGYDGAVPSDITIIIIEFAKIFIDSVILSPEEQQYLVKMIESQPQTSKFKHCEWKLLCRGSRDGKGDYNAFHKLCDGKKNTVCLVDLHEQGFVSGGYASSAWKSTDGNTPCKDDNAFLFTLRPMDKRKIFHRKRDKDGNFMKPKGGILHNKADAFNFGYNSFFWGNRHSIPCDTLIVINPGKKGYFDVGKNADLCGHGESGWTYTKFREFEVFQLIEQ